MPTDEKQDAYLQLQLRNAQGQMEALKDPEVVLVNMLRGTIAKLSVRSFVKTHGEVLNGDEAQLLEIARLREACNKEFESVQFLDNENSKLRLQCGDMAFTIDELRVEVAKEKELVQVAFLLFADICKALAVDPNKLEDPHELLPAIVQLKANHADMVARNAMLRERPDLPVDRIPAYERLITLQADNRTLRADLAHQRAVNQSMLTAIADIAEELGIDDEGFKNGGPNLLVDAINKLIEKAG